MVQPSFHSPQRPRFIWLRQCLYQLSVFAQLITAHKLSPINLMRNELIIYEDVDVKCFVERWKQSGIFISMLSMRSCTCVGVWILNWNQFHLWSNRRFCENGWKSRTCNGQTMATYMYDGPKSWATSIMHRAWRVNRNLSGKTRIRFPKM